MVKRCSWRTFNTDCRYPERLIIDGTPVNFHSILFKEISSKGESYGFVLAVTEICLFARKTATYMDYTLWQKRGKQRNI